MLTCLREMYADFVDLDDDSIENNNERNVLNAIFQ